MLERTPRSYIDTVLSELDAKRSPKGDAAGAMTRRPRTRRPLIPSLQAGYCAVCSLPYNSVQDHIRSKKHRKLIGEDANYIALNGSLKGFLQDDSLPFLNLNGVDAIGVHDSSFDEFSPKYKKRAMPRTRAGSVASDRAKPAPASDPAGHRLRSRKNINYMSPPSDDDSMQEKPDLGLPEEPANADYKEYRELRSSTKALAKLTEQVIPPTDDQEVWNSGRPKRACINKKRPSTDEYITPNSKTFYKVEVVSSKRPQKSNREAAKRHQSQSPKREEDKEKALIVKFKKMRNSELVQLNNEATNFLFPQKEDSDSDSETDNVSECGARVEVSCSEDGNCNDSTHSFKVDDDRSMDSTSSSTKGKKKRRTHAEAFIMDNQKYYKFETPGSRLRYHGSYLPAPALPKSPKFNGAFSPKYEDLKPDEPAEKKIKYNPDAKVKLDNYKFSFEEVPQEAPCYGAFRRIDKGEQTYIEFSDYFFDPFLLPYQMASIPPLDPRACLSHYVELKKRVCDPSPQAQLETASRSSTPEASVEGSTQSRFLPDHDDDSKLSLATVSSLSSSEDVKDEGNPSEEPDGAGAAGSGKNPRKSPRQHASTLAILSSLIQQRRKRKSKPVQSLPAIPEEPPKAKSPPRKAKPRVDYYAIARQIDKELDNALDDSLENYDLDIPMEQTVDFHQSKTSLAEILRLYDEDEGKGSETSCRRFLNGTPGRKPGRRKKTNKTGWPSKNSRRSTKREASKDKDENTDSEESDEDVCAEEVTPAVGESVLSDCDRVDNNGKVLMNKETNSDLQFQPYVCVQKLDGRNVAKDVNSPKRTKRKLRHMPGSPKSPRMLRKPRGRWYRER